MRRTNPGSTNLWSIIDRLQRRLEGEGLARDVIDAAVVQAVLRAVGGLPQPA